MNAEGKPLRARELGWLDHSQLKPGILNAITDVPGVQVGHISLIRGEPGPLVVGEGPVRTGITAVIPKPGDLFLEKVAAATFVQNGFGKTVGFAQIQETGALETPILLTSTLSVWQVANGLVEWAIQNYRAFRLDLGASINPVVGECNDGYLNDLRGRHVRQAHVLQVLDIAAPGVVAEGNVGAGTGSMTFGFKAGIGTSSRIVDLPQGESFALGVLVQANFGQRNQFLLQGKPVGQTLHDWPGETSGGSSGQTEQGSCIILIATNASLSHRQLTRLARRAPLGLARTGGVSGHGSGEFVLAFSTTNRKPYQTRKPVDKVDRLQTDRAAMDHFFQATVEAVEEAILNSLVAAETMIGRDHHICHQLPIDLIQPLIQSPHR